MLDPEVAELVEFRDRGNNEPHQPSLRGGGLPHPPWPLRKGLAAKEGREESRATHPHGSEGERIRSSTSDSSRRRWAEGSGAAKWGGPGDKEAVPVPDYVDCGDRGVSAERYPSADCADMLRGEVLRIVPS